MGGRVVVHGVGEGVVGVDELASEFVLCKCIL